MNEEPVVEDLINALKKTKHPSINASLVELGIVKDVDYKDGKIFFTLKLPFPTIPDQIRNMIVDEIKRVLTPFDRPAEGRVEIMNDAERQHFLEVEKANWKGAPEGVNVDPGF